MKWFFSSISLHCAFQYTGPTHKLQELFFGEFPLFSGSDSRFLSNGYSFPFCILSLLEPFPGLSPYPAGRKKALPHTRRQGKIPSFSFWGSHIRLGIVHPAAAGLPGGGRTGPPSHAGAELVMYLAHLRVGGGQGILGAPQQVLKYPAAQSRFFSRLIRPK